jgi:predicted 2-oxoglutarate/Fe(II)-dependent dioxygenase YbiX
VGITWIQSWVADPMCRELLLQADEARRLAIEAGSDPRQLVLIESLRTNLFRLWSDA